MIACLPCPTALHLKPISRTSRHLPSRARDEIEEFLRTTNALENKELKFLDWRGPNRAVKTIKRLSK